MSHPLPAASSHATEQESCAGDEPDTDKQGSKRINLLIPDVLAPDLEAIAKAQHRPVTSLILHFIVQAWDGELAEPPGYRKPEGKWVRRITTDILPSLHSFLLHSPAVLDHTRTIAEQITVICELGCNAWKAQHGDPQAYLQKLFAEEPDVDVSEKPRKEVKEEDDE